MGIEPTSEAWDVFEELEIQIGCLETVPDLMITQVKTCLSHSLWELAYNVNASHVHLLTASDVAAQELMVRAIVINTKTIVERSKKSLIGPGLMLAARWTNEPNAAGNTFYDWFLAGFLAMLIYWSTGRTELAIPWALGLDEHSEKMFGLHDWITAEERRHV